MPQHVQTGRPTEVRDRAPRAPAHLLQLPRGPQCLQVPQEHAHVPAWQGQTGPRRAVWPAGWATPTDARAQQRLRAVPRPPGASPARAPQSRPRARPAVAAQAWGPGVPVRPGKQPARTPGPAEVRGTPGVDENGALDQVQGQHRGGSAGLERLWPPVRPGAQAPGPESPTATSALGCLRGPALPPPHLAAPAPRPLCLRAVPRPRPPHLPPPAPPVVRPWPLREVEEPLVLTQAQPDPCTVGSGARVRTCTGEGRFLRDFPTQAWGSGQQIPPEPRGRQPQVPAADGTRWGGPQWATAQPSLEGSHQDADAETQTRHQG